MKIYTKTGDKGQTSLFGGKRIAKDHLRIEAYGTVDELNAFTAVLHDQCPYEEVKNTLAAIQSLLFNLGSVLASDPEKDFSLPGLKPKHIEELENNMDRMDAVLPELKNFILPSGHPMVSAAHVCRTVCRRAERRLVTLSHESAIDEINIIYLNRLSDYFFVLARYLGHMAGVPEIIWKSQD
ncbi:MAG: cob(I)yrinic acid a,c-diamide adenosyltransferase [Saprospiraceae bacterium]|nr:cob(I)yrinic acid a,c-diamide adenosyltransferase [Saprospiraceae bacterium]MBK7223710.1 cob(I)yrinic acid a,c-diamide adenosyltransferase [Saprospiraceae bacterium]MBK7787853.1 cob(I)yrinic acid a,c-diamide adenosyltransferase [Saprospiraceae bacterium]MBK8109084.1 cob(I)yrinic acid a,c-diamide adenosyltransferase [Saprospiraceae bacterium]MBK8849975.1 cob(I)yrinic acid a,c-diamide adenosyltransferase [Saprospiraceae bacterium]